MDSRDNFLCKPVIIDGARTPFMHSNKAFSEMSAFDLGSFAIQGLLSKTGIDPAGIEHVTMGTVLHEPKTSNIARECVLGSNLPKSVPANTVSLACISSNIAASQMANMITLGQVKMGIVGGVDTCSDPPIRVSQGLRKKLVKMSKTKGAMKKVTGFLGQMSLSDISLDIPKVAEFSNGKSMGQGAEVLAQQAGVSREESDLFAERSHKLAVKAQKEGIFDDYLCPLYCPPSFKPLLKDDGPRGDTTLESLAKLRKAFDKQFGVCTAGNSSFLTDGASSLLMTSMKQAEELKLKPRAVLVDSFYNAGDAFDEMLSGPALTIPYLLQKNNLSVDAIDVWEIHEAFASQVLSNLAYLKSDMFAKERLGLDKAIGEIPLEKINIWGGSLSLGHPFGATGARLLYTAAKRLELSGSKYAVVSGCAAGGHGSAMLLQNPNV